MNVNSLSVSFVLFFVILYSSSAQKDVAVKKVLDPVIHGEGPHWDKERQVLYYVDIQNQTVIKYNPKTKEVNRVYFRGGPVSLVVPDQFDQKKYVIGRGLDLVSVTWDGKSEKPSSMEVLSSVDREKPQNRFNDGKVDASGRLWAGTMGPENPDVKLDQGSLYSFDWSNKFLPIKHLSPVSVSNGIAWNKNDSLMYYIDSPTRVVNVFDFDLFNGKLSNKRELFSLEKYNISGFPDGMAIDKKDNLWIAVFKGGCVLNVDTKEGKLLQKINLPVQQVTSCAFGGENLQDLYVTTSRVNLTPDELAKQPLAGALFKIEGLKVKGQMKSNSIRII